MNVEISVIVPVYNKKKLIGRCIKSVLMQTFVNFELILVNDGSIDDSEKICNEFAKKDRRIKVVSKDNNGVSSARNLGIELAIGEEICFVDADDWVESDMLEKLYEKKQIHNVDFVISGYYRDLYEKGNIYINYIRGVSEEIIAEKNKFTKVYSYFLRHHVVCIQSPCFKLYNACLLKKHKIRFDESIVCFEDMIFNLNYLSISSSLIVIKDILYHYCSEINESGLDRRSKVDLVDEVSLIYPDFLNFIKSVGSDEELENKMFFWMIDAYQMVFKKLSQSGVKPNEQKEVLDHIFEDQTFNFFLNQKKINLRFYKFIKKLIELKLYKVAFYLIQKKLNREG